jgi:hypothetical protein
MSAQIDEHVSKCEACQTNANANPRELLKPHTIPDRPWQKVGTDLFEWKGKAHFIVQIIIVAIQRLQNYATPRHEQLFQIRSYFKLVYTAFSTRSYQTMDLNIPHKNTSNSRKITTLPIQR